MVGLSTLFCKTTSASFGVPLYGAAWVFTQLSVCVWQGGRLSFLDVLGGGYMALLHLIGCYLGLLAAALLQYAFAGEEFDHENDEEL